MEAPPQRTLAYDPRFESEREAIQPDFHRFDEAWRYMEYVLARWPTFGKQTDTPEI